MKVYTLKEAARVSKIGKETLKRACEERLIKATRTPGRTWLISELSLQEALDNGIDLQAAGPRRSGPKKAMPEGLRRYQEAKRKEKRPIKAA